VTKVERLDLKPRERTGLENPNTLIPQGLNEADRRGRPVAFASTQGEPDILGLVESQSDDDGRSLPYSQPAYIPFVRYVFE